MNELKPEDVMRALECWASGKPCQEECSILEHEEGASCLKLTTRSALALLREKDEELAIVKNERDEARRDCGMAERNHFESVGSVKSLHARLDAKDAEIERLRTELKGETYGKIDL